MYTQTTRSIKVTVVPSFLDEQSDPEESRYVWAYRVRIENQGRETVQLMHRRWMITDAEGRVQEVHGPGVIGEQPVIRPGDDFEYTSGTPLTTPSGIMSGSYGMRGGDGADFEIEVPAFSLDSPFQAVRLN